MIPPIISIRDLLTHHGWGHLAAPIRPAPVFRVFKDTSVTVSKRDVVYTKDVCQYVIMPGRTWT